MGDPDEISMSLTVIAMAISGMSLWELLTWQVILCSPWGISPQDPPLLRQNSVPSESNAMSGSENKITNMEVLSKFFNVNGKEYKFTTHSPVLCEVIYVITTLWALFYCYIYSVIILKKSCGTNYVLNEHDDDLTNITHVISSLLMLWYSYRVFWRIKI